MYRLNELLGREVFDQDKGREQSPPRSRTEAPYTGHGEAANVRR
jgi:hypothetical protein